MKILSVLFIVGLIGLANVKPVEEKTNLAPEISLENTKGETINLSSLRGNVVLVDFWASWCKPCLKSRKGLTEIYNNYQNKTVKSGGKFEIYSVSLDKNKESWLNAINKYNMKWTNHVSELKGFKSDVVKSYNIKGIPNNVLLNQEGEIIAKNVYGDELINILEKL